MRQCAVVIDCTRSEPHPCKLRLDLTKNVLRVRGIAAEGSVTFNWALRSRLVRAFFEKLAPRLASQNQVVM